MTANIQEYAFPTVAIIRKGAPKGKNQPGKDLENKLRIAWAPGSDFARAAWDATYGPGTYQPTEIHAMLFLPKVQDSLQIYNEAYQAGRMVLRATDRQVLMKKDPLTGKYLVRDGDPYEAYTPGEPITYTRGDKTFTLPVRTSIRLKLFIPEIGQPVQFLLKSTSYYDAVNLRQQMGAIQALADMLNRGIAGGIPIIIYRQAQELTWNKTDGSASRVTKWLINVRVDERWIAAATQRMSQFALTGERAVGLLKPPQHIEGDENPDLPEERDLDEEPGDEIQGEYEETLPDGLQSSVPTTATPVIRDGNTVRIDPNAPIKPSFKPAEPTQDGTTAAQEQKDPEKSEQPAPESILQQESSLPEPQGSPASEPTPLPQIKVTVERADKLTPDEVTHKLEAWKNNWTEKQNTEGREIKDAPLLRTMLKTIIEETLDGIAIHNAQTVAQARNEVTEYLTGYRSMDQMPIAYVRALKAWLRPTYNEADHLVPDPIAAIELRNAYRQAVGLPDME